MVMVGFDFWVDFLLREATAWRMQKQAAASLGGTTN
jgi:hypothetical protein